jgi:single-strand DNA-binding protein
LSERAALSVILLNLKNIPANFVSWLKKLATIAIFEIHAIVCPIVDYNTRSNPRSQSSMSLNVVTLVGRVGGDPETRRFESGNMKTTATLAVNRNSKNDQPDWFNLEFWGKQAEVVENWVKKGSLIGVKGALKLESWTDKSTGATRTKPVVLVERLELLGSRKDNEAAMGGNSGSYEDDF